VGLLKWTAAALFALSAPLFTAGCSADAVDEDMGESEDAQSVLAGRTVSKEEVATHLRNAGWPENMIGRMVCVAQWESSFRERARNGRHYGLFQISSKNLGSPQMKNCPRTAEAVYPAATNAKCALSIFQVQGIGAWSADKAHPECKRARAPGSTTVETTTDDDDATQTPAPTTSSEAPGDACFSKTLGHDVDEGGCVQSSSPTAHGVWFQCNDGRWYRGGNETSGPFGACTSSTKLQE
jgi:hypothetical protein